jgi:hypothetical protein
MYVASDSSSSALGQSKPVRISKRPLDVKPLRTTGPSPVLYMPPTPGTRNHTAHMAHVVLDSSPSVLYPRRPSLVSTRALQANTHGLTPRTPRISRVCILLDCNQEARVPSVLELLLLVDFENLDIGRKQIDVFCGLVNYGLEDAVDIYSQPAEILAELGGLGEEEACRLHAYCRDAILDPLGLTETRRCPREDSSIVEIPPPPWAVKQTPKRRVSNGIKQEKENVPPQLARQKLKHKTEQSRAEEINQWLDGLQSGEEVLENGEVLTTAANTDVSYDADSEEDGSTETQAAVCQRGSPDRFPMPGMQSNDMERINFAE